MKVVAALAVTSLLGSAIASADDELPEAEDAVTSYRQYTLATDALGIALLVAGGFAERDGGRDTYTSDQLFALGGLTTMLGAPIIHIARGHVGRGVGSFFLRGGLATVGMLVAVAGNSGCGSGQPPTDGALFGDDFLCELDYVGYGIVGGLIVASAIDAAALTDEPVERTTWAPQLAATRDGVRAGVAFTW